MTAKQNFSLEGTKGVLKILVSIPPQGGGRGYRRRPRVSSKERAAFNATTTSLKA